jgi:HPt (histidine-containing phosphotransfer) domain-containing protein
MFAADSPKNCYNFVIMTSPLPSIASLDELPGVPVLDRPTLDQLIDLDDGGLGLTIEMIEIFEADQPPRLSGIQKALEVRDMARVTELSHTIKGSAGTIGAPRLRAVAALLEASARGHKVEAPPHDIFACLANAYHDAHGALKKHITASRS